MVCPDLPILEVGPGMGVLTQFIMQKNRAVKVVELGKCDKLFINTSGIGIVPPGIRIAPDQATPGDVVICSGPIGLHGITILSARESLGFETDLKSDTASLNIMISELLHTIGEVHVLRDPTRGGVSGTLNEIAQDAGVDILLDEDALPIPEAVRAASEMLGLDPLYIANEGLVLVILPESRAEQALPSAPHFPIRWKPKAKTVTRLRSSPNSCCAPTTSICP